jgi:hypothetical protein
MVIKFVEKNKNIIVAVVFAFMFMVGLAVYKDYGISWDEPIQRKYGEDVYNYVFGKGDHLLKNKDRFYGPTFEFVLLVGEKSFGLTDLKEIYHFRHIVTFAFFVVGAYFLYLVTREILGDWKLGLMASVMFSLTPRIFAHAFYNSKDIPFMCSLIVVVYFILRFKKSMNVSNAVLLGIAMGISTTIRLMGMFSIVLLIIFLVDRVFKMDWKVLLLRLVIVFVVYAVVTLVLWPTLWQNPVENFMQAVEQMAKYPQSTSMYLYGEKIKSTDVPWHYTLSWMLATIPAGYFLLLGLGLIGVGKSIKMGDKDLVNILAVCAWLILPMVTVVILRSNLYDSWRQMFFIYPAFVIVCIYAIKYARQYLVLGVFLLAVLSTTIQMIGAHPHQNVYFGAMAGFRHLLRENFEMDYWGVSYKQAYDLIEEIDSRDKILVMAANYPGETNLVMANNPDRFEITKNSNEANYYITNYRGSLDKTFQGKGANLMVGDDYVTLVGIYRLR